MKFFKSAGALWLFVILVVGYAYVFEYKDKKEKAAQELEQKKLFKLSIEDIQSVQIHSLRGDLRFEKKNMDWKVFVPFEDDLDKGALQNLYNTLTSESYEEIVSEGETDLKIYGLENPFFIEVQTLKGIQKLKIGTVSGLSGKKYLQMEGDSKILIGGMGWDPLLNKDFQEYRKKDIFGVGDAEVVKVKIDSQKGKLVVLRQDGRWKLEGDTYPDIDSAAVDSMMSSLLLLRANQVDLVSKSVKPQNLKIQMELKNGSYINVTSYAPEASLSRVEVSGRPVAFKISSALMEQFLKSSSDLRNRSAPFKFQKDDVYDVNFISENNSFHVQKEELSWVWAGEGDQVIQSAEVDRFLNKLSQLRVGSYFEKNTQFQESGKSVLILKSKTQELLRLEISPKAQSGFLVTKSSLMDGKVGISSSEFSELSNIQIKNTSKNQKENP